MRILLAWVSLGLVATLASFAQSTPKTSPATKKTSQTAVKAPSKGAHTSSRPKSSSSKSSKISSKSKKSKSRKSAKGWRSRGQQNIDPQRAREIQQALIREHYLSGEPSGTWDAASQKAMEKFQADNGWQSKSIPDSRALIKLGLGPDHEHLLNPESAMTVGIGQGSASSSTAKSPPVAPTTTPATTPVSDPPANHPQ